MLCHRSGCKEGGHSSWGECARAARIGLTPGETNSKVIMSDLGAYRKAREQGVQPASTNRRDTDIAMAVSEKTGRPFDAAGTGAV